MYKIEYRYMIPTKVTMLEAYIAYVGSLNYKLFPVL